ncbi:MAG TPA: SMI1/KNR4 family protein, partial [Chitinophagaceae bacterium]
MDNIRKIILQWKSANVELNDPASIEDIAEAERALNFTFPSDFKNLYLKVDGFKNYDWQANMFSIWPIETIIRVYKEHHTENFVGFCDYLL